MKYLLFLTSLALFSSLSFAQKDKYNSKLAKELGADEYGMKKYVLVILKTGTSARTDEQFVDSCFNGHMQNIKRLVDEKKLIVAGPLGKNEKTYRGIFILNVSTINEALEIVKTDPAVHEQLLDAEYYEWYGSAALPLYLPKSNEIARKKHF